ncbi:MAG: hypothetical protein Q6353_013190 [Candidatus Sigynarchaeum springense]
MPFRKNTRYRDMTGLTSNIFVGHDDTAIVVNDTRCIVARISAQRSYGDEKHM